MRKIRLHMQVSADDFAAGQNGELDWTTQHMDREAERYNASIYNHADTIIIGRVLYEELRQYWQDVEMGKENHRFDREFANRINTIPKLILSTTLQSVDWENSLLLCENVFDKLREIKERPGRDIVVSGGIGTARGLILQGLIDEFNLMVHPVILGTGKSLLAGLEGLRELQLVRTRRFRSGIIAVEYRVAPASEMARAA